MRSRLRSRPQNCPKCGRSSPRAHGETHYLCERCGHYFAHHEGEWRRAADVRTAYENSAYRRDEVRRLLRATTRALKKLEALEEELFEALSPILRAPPVHAQIPKAMRVRVLERDDGKCQLCDSSDDGVELDHIIPTVLGGPDMEWNLWALCEPCNREKGARLIHEGLTKLHQLISSR